MTLHLNVGTPKYRVGAVFEKSVGTCCQKFEIYETWCREFARKVLKIQIV